MISIEEIKKEEAVSCYHCGEDCDDVILAHDKSFCCTGCRTVYEILSENGLDDYYDYGKNPGLTMLSRDVKKYMFLENEDISDTLLDFSENDLARVTLYIPSIHCSSCIWLLENLYKLNPSVKESRVNFMRREASITFNKTELSLKDLSYLLDNLGYGPLINWDSKGKKKKKKIFGPLQMKLGVAGFCFGNIMLLSFPEYFGFEISDGGFKTFFSYLNLLLALPVLIYSSFDYLKSAFKGLRQRMVNIDVPIALGIVALFSRSTFEVLSSTGPGYFDSFTGLIFFLLIGRWFQDKTYENLSFERDYKSYFPLAISKVNGEESEVVPIQDLQNGDIVKVRNNEIIPADCILISENTQIDYSFVTGEETPVKKEKGETIFAGGRQKGRDIKLKVKKPVAQSYLTSLWNTGGEEKLVSQRIIDKVAKYFTWIILSIALLAGIYWSFIPEGATWEIVTAVLIVACPCALALSVPFTYGNILRITGREGFYLKSSNVVEKFHKLDLAIFDKTGTLTWPEKGKLSWEGKDLTERELLAIKAITSSSSHPLSVKLSSSIRAKGKLPEITGFKEEIGQGISAHAGGDTFRLGNLTYVNGIDKKETNRSVVGVNINGNYLGKFEISTEYRKGFKEVIESLSTHLEVGMLSGDKPFDKGFLQKVFPSSSEIQFELKPDEKRKFVEAKIKHGKKVMMVGDGLNDAAALSASTVGVAITDDISAFSPACDAIYTGKRFDRFHRLFDFIKSSRKIVIVSFVISFLYNLVGLSFAVTGYLTPIFAAILMPLSSISILVFTTLAVNASAKINKVS